MYHERRKRRQRRRKIRSFVAMSFALTVITAVLCGLAYPDVDARPEIPATGATYEPVLVPIQHKEPVLVPIQYREYVPAITPQQVPEPEHEEDEFRYYDHISLEYDLQKLLWEACEETGCQYELALSVIYRESAYTNVDGDNGDSIGYMQVQPRWHQDRMDRLGVTDLSDPLSNFRVGCDLLAELIERYGSIESALSFYNTGKPGTSPHADRVLGYMNETFPTIEK